MPREELTGTPREAVDSHGPRLREVQSYARRGSKFTPSQRAAWNAHHRDWVIDVEWAEAPGFELDAAFDRRAPLIVEIGSGVGEATAVLAAARPEANVLALEVWLPGVAASLARVAELGATNVRFCGVDAVWALRNLLESEQLAGLWTFFPDPWPKTKHHKRRLVRSTVASLAADRMAPGAKWRLATDWGDYADQMRRVLDAEPCLDGGPAERWADRPVTKFERKGVAAGRTITDFAYTRRRAAPRS